MDIVKVSVKTKIKVQVDLTGGHLVKATYMDREFVSDWVLIEYTLDEVTGRWVADCVKTTGLRVLKPGPSGERRIGKDRHEAHWSVFGKDIQTAVRISGDSPFPKWASKLIDELRPSGAVTLPGTG